MTHSAPVSLQPSAAERLAGWIGSWPFIIGQAIFLGTWFLVNVIPHVFHWDPYPWLACNIVMSAEAAFTGPVLLIAANVAAARDRAQITRIESMVQLTDHIARQLDNHEREELEMLHQIQAYLHLRFGAPARDDGAGWPQYVPDPSPLRPVDLAAAQ